MLKTIIRSSLKSAGFEVCRLKQDVKLAALEKTGTFEDSGGVSHTLYRDFRSIACPRWPGFFKTRQPSISNSKARQAFAHTRQAEKVLQSCHLSLRDKDVLEIGCGDGLNAAGVVAQGCARMTATDYPIYWARESRPDEDIEQRIREKRDFLDELRAHALERFAAVHSMPQAPGVEFGELDITSVSADSPKYDAIVSFETLEHVGDVEACMANHNVLLKPGGFAYHHYNPFFSFDGGHSLCTLDFPWGHAQLTPEDFRRYVETYRPEEVKLADEFFNLSLNRVTMADMREAVTRAGLEILAFVYQFTDQAHFIEPTTLNNVRALYPKAELQDLLAPSIYIIIRKPAG